MFIYFIIVSVSHCFLKELENIFPMFILSKEAPVIVREKAKMLYPPGISRSIINFPH